MAVQLRNPALAKFVDEQVRVGNFPDAEAVVEDALTRMMEQEELTDEDVKAITEAEAQIDRGEYVDFATFASEMRKKYCGK